MPYLLTRQNLSHYFTCTVLFNFLFDRFVRFVSTPEILERVTTIESEILQIEEAISVQSSDNIGLSSVSLFFLILWTLLYAPVITIFDKKLWKLISVCESLI
jgi:hypothetical protein